MSYVSIFRELLTRQYLLIQSIYSDDLQSIKEYTIVVKDRAHTYAHKKNP